MKRRLGLLGPVLLCFALLPFAPSGGAEQRRRGLRALPLSESSRAHASKASRAGKGGLVSVLVRLEDALAAYRGGIPGLLPTSLQVTGGERLDVRAPRSRAYLRYLEARWSRFEETSRRLIPRAKLIHRFSVVFGGASLLVPEGSEHLLYRIPGVRAVYPDALLSVSTVRSPRFLSAPRLWSQIGGADRAGEGAIVGIVDSGIWPEHPSFSDPDPEGNPYPPPPESWSGTGCELGSEVPGDEPFDCNRKLLGARRFMETYESLIDLLPSEFRSARDDDGHGTHTASIAAGNHGVEASMGSGASFLAKVSGVAPRARLAVYRVCGLEGCFVSDSVAAVEQAVRDGIDVINFSISGGDQPYADPVSLAFLDAYAANVFVATSAGNAGPAPDTVSHREPWTTTVGSSTQDVYFAGRLLLAGAETLALVGTSVTGEIAAPLVLAADRDGLPEDHPEKGTCNAPFPAGSFVGEIVVCRRGGVSRVLKSDHVAAGGAGGLVLYNEGPAETLNHDKHYLPAIQLGAAEAGKLMDFLDAHPGPVMATIVQGLPTRITSHPGGPAILASGTAGGKDVIAASSSRGGPGQSLGVNKPDLVAPGVQILAGGTPQPNESGVASSFGAPGLFLFLSGTSMAAPHVAGAAALLRDLHPDWTPWQVKSALMLTARRNGIVGEDGASSADPFDFGSGRLSLALAGDPGLSFEAPSREDFLTFAARLWDLNYPSLFVPTLPGRMTVRRQIRSELDRGAAWQLWTSGSPDLRVSVPKKLILRAGESETIEITVDARDVPMGEVRHTTLHLAGADRHADFPITVRRQEVPVALALSCQPLDLEREQQTECLITLTNRSSEPSVVHLEDRLPSTLRLEGAVEGAVRVDDRSLSFDGVLPGADSLGVSVTEGEAPFGYFPLSALGVPPLGSVGDETLVNFSVPEFQYQGERYSRIAMVSNGYLVVGGGTGGDLRFLNQVFPDPNRPNAVLAPFWTDLDPTAGGALRAAVVEDAAGSWLVFDWEGVPNYGDKEPNFVQAWIGLNGDEDVTFAYGPISDGNEGLLTIGAENAAGNRGDNFYANGSGTLPEPFVTELRVESIDPGGPGPSHTVRFRARAARPGAWQNCAALDADSFYGTALACVEGRVQP